MAVEQAKATVQARPAETGGFASGVAVLICYIAGVDDPAILTALAVVVGALPGVITTIVVQIRARKEEGNAENSQPAQG